MLVGFLIFMIFGIRDERGLVDLWRPYKAAFSFDWALRTGKGSYGRTAVAGQQRIGCCCCCCLPRYDTSIDRDNTWLGPRVIRCNRPGDTLSSRPGAFKNKQKQKANSTVRLTVVITLGLGYYTKSIWPAVCRVAQWAGRVANENVGKAGGCWRFVVTELVRIAPDESKGNSLFFLSLSPMMIRLCISWMRRDGPPVLNPSNRVDSSSDKKSELLRMALRFIYWWGGGYMYFLTECRTADAREHSCSTLCNS